MRGAGTTMETMETTELKTSRRGFGRASARAAAGVVAAAAGLGHLSGGPGVPAAQAWDEWCDTDPARLIQTDDGVPLPYPVFYLTGGQIRDPLDAPRVAALLLGAALTESSSRPAPGGGTEVTLVATVPTGLGARFPTRLTATAGPLGTLKTYAQVYGTSGERMVARFVLPPQAAPAAPVAPALAPTATPTRTPTATPTAGAAP
jgi:hypothetical protein